MGCAAVLLTNKTFAVVDKTDLDRVTERLWHVSGRGVPCTRMKDRRTNTWRSVTLSKFIMGIPFDKDSRIQYVNGVAMDCRRTNIVVHRNGRTSKTSRTRA